MGYLGGYFVCGFLFFDVVSRALCSYMRSHSRRFTAFPRASGFQLFKRFLFLVEAEVVAGSFLKFQRPESFSRCIVRVRARL